ncbi:MAG TPA: hypothetical protein VH247_03010 [Thermoleophilaceae bacterium]|jgi:hypothetical protein|nr:hypothetical protein [Thermoleophilaceae bacterium]
MFKRTVLALAIPAAAVAVIMPATSAPASPSGTLTVTSKLDSKTMVMVDAAKPKGRSAGDTISFSTTLVRDGKPAGRGEFAQTLADNRYQGVVMQVELLLPDGTISLTGGGLSRRAPGGADPRTQTELAVVGGTGAYAGANGTAKLMDVGRTSQRMDLAFTP